MFLQHLRFFFHKCCRNIKAISKLASMFFYLNSLNYQSVGRLDGSSQILLDYNKTSKYSNSKFLRPREIHKYPNDNSRQLIPFKLVSTKTKLTDFCFAGQASAYQKIVSPKVKSIFECFTGLGSRFLPIDIYDAQEVCHKYYVLSFETELSDTYVDFDKTIYSVFDRLGENLDEITGRANLRLGPSQIARVKYFSFKNPTRLPDFFVSPSMLIHFISSKLASRFIEEKVTGIDIYKYDSQSDLGINTIRRVNHKSN